MSRKRKPSRSYRHRPPPIGHAREVIVPPRARVLAAVRAMPSVVDWAAVEADLRPVFRRLRPLPPGAPEPLSVLMPPGVSVGIGIDIGPAFAWVTRELVTTWDRSVEEVAAVAVANLRRRARRLDADAVREMSVTDVPVRYLQSGEGFASTLVLVVDELVRLFGAQPQLFVAPMRDVLLSFPAHVDPAVAAWLTSEIEAIDPNALHLEAFLLKAGALVCQPLPDEARHPLPGPGPRELAGALRLA